MFWRPLHWLNYTVRLWNKYIYIFYLLCFGRQCCYPYKDLVIYTQAKFHHPKTFGCRNIAFQIWCLFRYFPWSKWPKAFLWAVYIGVVLFWTSLSLSVRLFLIYEGLCVRSRYPRTSNYIPQILWDVITCPCPWYLILIHKFSYVCSCAWYVTHNSKTEAD